MIGPSTGVKKGSWCPSFLKSNNEESCEVRVVKEALRVLNEQIAPFQPSYIVFGNVDEREELYMVKVDSASSHCFSPKIDCSLDVFSTFQKSKEDESILYPLPLLPQTCVLNIPHSSPYFIQGKEYYLFDPARESIKLPKNTIYQDKHIRLLGKEEWKSRLQSVVDLARQILQKGKRASLEDFVAQAEVHLNSLQDLENGLNENIALTLIQEQCAKDLANVVIILLKDSALSKAATTIRNLEQIKKIEKSKLVQAVARRIIEKNEDRLDFRSPKKIKKQVLKSLPDA